MVVQMVEASVAVPQTPDGMNTMKENRKMMMGQQLYVTRE
jgi:hypothetical protein